jgi:RimJ/RimL family protein N-acetyltransferase
VTVFATSRLRFEPFCDAHLEGLHAINADPDVARYLTKGRPQTLDETRAWIERVKARWTAWGFSWWSLIELASGQIVGAGCIQYLTLDPRCELEIGWRIRRDRWRQGFAIEAASRMTTFAFETIGTPTLCAVCHPENLGSIAVMKKLGMRYRGLEPWYGKESTVYEIARTAPNGQGVRSRDVTSMRHRET